jgi:hypothetical protein
MRLPLLVSTVLIVSVVSSVSTALICLRLVPQAVPIPSVAPALPLPPPAIAAPAPPPAPADAPTRPMVATRQADPAPEPPAIPPPPPPLDEVIPPPPEAPPQYTARIRTLATAPPAAAPAPAPEDHTPIFVQHEVNDTIYRDYYGCTQAEVVVINTCQRCYQFNHADVLAVCLVARWAGVPLSVAFRTLYDDDHGSLQALLAGYHLDAAIFIVSLPADLLCPGPYQRPYHLFRDLRGSDASFSNDEYRALISLKIACEFQGREPAQFFASVQHGDTPLQVLYRTPTAPPAALGRSWSGVALRQLANGAAAGTSERRPAGAALSASARPAREVEASAVPHAGALPASATRLDQASRLDQPSRISQSAPGEVQERAPASAADGGHGGTRPANPPLERRASEALNEHPLQAQAPREAVNVPQQAAPAHVHAEPSEPVPAIGGQPAASGSQAAAGATYPPHH